jgi:LEA14-like dessication related protein
MKRNLLLIGGAVAAAALYFWSRGKASEKLRVYFQGISTTKSGKLIPNIFVNFRLVNPTSTALSVDSIAGDIIVNGKAISAVQNLSKINIPANGQTIYPIQIYIQGFQAVMLIMDFIKKRQKVNITFEGTVNSSGFVIPLKQTVASF